METVAAIVHSSFPVGLDAALIDVRCTIRPQGGIDVFGTSQLVCKEASVRVRSALTASGVPCVGGAVVDLSGTPTNGAQLDLAIAIAVLSATGTTPAPDGLLVLGELGLDGSVRAVRGVLAAAQAALAAGLRGAIVPMDSAWEAVLIDGLAVYAVDSLGDAIAVLRGERAPGAATKTAPSRDRLDFSDVRGQAAAVDAIARAAVRREDFLLSGPPGTGKTMLARRLPTLLPEMTSDEQRAVVRAYSAAGLASGIPLADERPFRAPHHSISTAALVGDVGPTRRPGELQLAAHGVLYLDEVAEFRLDALATLAKAISRMAPSVRPRVVASANPCPCGWLGSAVRPCTCEPTAIERHRRRLQGVVEILGLDVTVAVPAVTVADLRAARPARSSARLRACVWRRTWQGDMVALDDVVATYLQEHPWARVGEVMDRVHTLCPDWIGMCDDVARACALCLSEAATPAESAS